MKQGLKKCLRPFQKRRLEYRWMRFELITDDPEQIKQLNRILDRTDLSRYELAVIVASLRVRPEFSLKDFET